MDPVATAQWDLSGPPPDALPGAGATLRQVAMRYNRSKATFCGSPQQVADVMQAWVEAGACDGFMVTFPVMPTCLQDFVDKVVPELQRRGMFREDYAGPTLRDHLGLARPAAHEGFSYAEPEAPHVAHGARA